MYSEFQSTDYAALIKSLNVALVDNTKALQNFTSVLTPANDQVSYSYSFTVGANKHIAFTLLVRENFLINPDGSVLRQLLQTLTMTGLVPEQPGTKLRAFDKEFVN